MLLNVCLRSYFSKFTFQNVLFASCFIEFATKNVVVLIVQLPLKTRLLDEVDNFVGIQDQLFADQQPFYTKRDRTRRCKLLNHQLSDKLDYDFDFDFAWKLFRQRTQHLSPTHKFKADKYKKAVWDHLSEMPLNITITICMK